MDEYLHRDVHGVRLGENYLDEHILSAINYKPRKGDIIVVTYPKCGTNWTMAIIWNIIKRAKHTQDIAEFSLMCPFIEQSGAGAAEHPARMGPIMTHLPMKVFKPVEYAKYVYVARNPYDCAVSNYHFCKGYTPKTVTDLSFDRFLPLFLKGKLMLGDYFDHLLPWYERRNDANILFITYEQLKSDTKGMVLRIADFQGENHGASLRDEPGLLERVTDACSLQSVRNLFNVKADEKLTKTAALALEWSMPFEMPEYLANKKVEMHEGSQIVRKGIVGDWRNHFTCDNIAEMKAWITKKTKGSDVMKLWEECDLP